MPASELPVRRLPSTCPLDCPDACGLVMTVQGNRVTKLEGDPDHPFTRGFACVKMYAYPERQNHPERLERPLRRVGAKGEGRFEPIAWDEALDLVAHELERVIETRGAEAILPYHYAGTMGLVERDQPLAFFRALGASELDLTICSATGGAAFRANYGPRILAPRPQDLEHSDLIVLWGINAARSNLHLVPLIKAAKRRGAYVLHVDPYRNETTRIADEHWQIRPGTDAALALALGHVLLREGLVDRPYLDAHADGLEAYANEAAAWSPARAAERCGLDAARIEAIAQRWGRAAAPFVRVGYGMTRNEGGGNAIRAITLLPALTGAWTRRGGGANLSTSNLFPLNATRYDGSHRIREGVRHVNMNRLASALEDRDAPVDALVVFNANPAAVAPDSVRVRRGLARDDLFTVVLEHMPTDTVDYADVVLPATTFLEHPDLYISYGHTVLQWADPVIPPRGEARPNSAVFRELAARMGVDEPVIEWSAEEVARDLLDSDHPWLDGLDFERLQREKRFALPIPDDWRPYGDGSSFPDGKIRFGPPPRQLDFEENPDDAFPLRLISPPGEHVLNTSMGNVDSLLEAAGGEPRVLLHPDDAAELGVIDGVRSRVVSRHGEILRRIEVTDAARRGVAVAIGQWWPKLAPDGKGLNDLTNERLTDLGGGSTFGNVPVRVEPVTSAVGRADPTRAPERVAAAD